MALPSDPILVNEILLTADIFLKESQRLFRPHGLTGAQFNVLNTLAKAERDGLMQRELGEVLVVDRSNVTGLVDRMAKAGWVERRVHPTDRRAHRVALTPAGRGLWAEVAPRYTKVLRLVAGEVPAARAAATVKTLVELRERATQWTLPGAETR